MSATPRRTPYMPRIINHWREHYEADFPDLAAAFIGWGEPFCFACGWLAPVQDSGPRSDAWARVGGWLERAHLQDFRIRRDDSLGNVVPLCQECHDAMPEFDDRAAAVAWVNRRERTDPFWQLFTDRLLAGKSCHGRATVLRARARFYEWRLGLVEQELAAAGGVPVGT